jgi:NAD(P)-dependent dehydrogenase (short-subunit alcohol dehydrogenase family)
MERERLDGRVRVIAGCAGAIGEAVAARLIEEGAIVVGIDRGGHAVGALSRVADLSQEVKMRDVFADIHGQTGRIDVLYNNAGLILANDTSALETSTETLEQIFAANFRTTWLCCEHGIPYMVDSQPAGGAVINTSSFLAGMGSATG